MADFEGLNPEFSSRLQAFMAASGGRVWLTSGYRSVDEQQRLWDAALKKYGDPEVADNWVARPGKSNHGRGVAGDLGFKDAQARSWAHANAARYGLRFPMDWEPWHIEPINAAALSDRGAYTTPPTGHIHPADALNEGEDPYDPGTQFARILGMMASPQGPDSPDAGLMESPQMPQGTLEPEEQASQMIGGSA